MWFVAIHTGGVPVVVENQSLPVIMFAGSLLKGMPRLAELGEHVGNRWRKGRTAVVA